MRTSADFVMSSAIATVPVADKDPVPINETRAIAMGKKLCFILTPVKFVHISRAFLYSQAYFDTQSGGNATLLPTVLRASSRHIRCAGNFNSDPADLNIRFLQRNEYQNLLPET